MSLEQTGIVSAEQFRSILPSEERRMQGPYAIAECFQNIPCNPCTTSCKVHAVTQDNINALPQIHYETCIGCGKCVAVCPGLACFVIDETKEEGKVWITMPYELLPVPEKGMTVTALNREGIPVTEGVVKRVVGGLSMNHTYLITVSVDADYLDTVRSIQVDCTDQGGDSYAG